jgi:hypothetical protein
MATRTKLPVPAPIREFTDLQLKIQLGFKNNQNLFGLNFIRFFTKRRFITFFKVRI